MSNPTTETIVVLGNARSGTSVTTGILKSLGVDIDHTDLIGMKGAPKGVFQMELYESLPASRINQMIYSGWFGVDPLSFKGDLHWNLPFMRPEVIEEHLGDYDFYIESFLKKKEGLWGFKNPKTCLTLKHWQRVLKNPKYIVVTRNPLSIARSWETLKTKIDHNGDPVSLAFVMKENNFLYNYVHDCLKDEKEKNVLYIAYEQLLNEPEQEIKKIAKFLGLKATKKKMGDARACIKDGKKY